MGPIPVLAPVHVPVSAHGCLCLLRVGAISRLLCHQVKDPSDGRRYVMQSYPCANAADADFMVEQVS